MKVRTVIVATIVAGSIVAAVWWYGLHEPKPAAQVTQPSLGVAGERMIKGVTGAPVEMIQYVDMMCADCARFHEEVMPRIEDDYVKTDKLSYEVRVVSKINHDDAQTAAEGAYCAAEQGKFWVYLDLAYEKLRNLPDSAAGIEDVSTFKGNNARSFAAEVGLNVPSWEYCVKQAGHKDVIDQHEKTMSTLNAYGTPHSVINGENYNGAPPYNVFKTVIDAALDKQQEKK